MRTVTFADPDLIEWMNGAFVLLWSDARPIDEQVAEPGEIQPVYTPEELAAYPDGGGGRNLRTVFVRPDGSYLHGLHGWWPAALFREECDRALRLLAIPEPGEAAARQLADMDGLDAEAARLRRDQPAEFRKPVGQSPVARRAAALELLAREARTLREETRGSTLETMLESFREENSGREFK